MSLDGKRVFVIEDDLRNKAIALMLLERAGATVGFERWGTSTIEKLRSFMPIDIILLDLMFPRGVTGYDIFSKIRSFPEFDAIPIVAVSAADTAIAIPKAQEMGFSGFIAKPIDFYRFTTQVEKVLENQEVWDTPSQI